MWKFQSLHFYPTFITDYDKGWAKDAQPAQGINAALPPDRPPTEVYEIYPKAHVPPVSLSQSGHRQGAHLSGVDRGGPTPQLAAAALEPATAAPAPKLVRGRGKGTGSRRGRSRAGEGLPRDRESRERLRLLPRQEPVGSTRRPVREGQVDGARAARRLQGRTRARIPVAGVRPRPGGPGGRTTGQSHADAAGDQRRRGRQLRASACA